MQDIRKILNDVGLSGSEISVYVALLEGATGAKEIMSATGEKRPTVYYALGALLQRGLVSKTGKEHGSLFQLESPDRLSALVEQKLDDQRELLDTVNTFATTYALKEHSSKIHISYFDSIESIRSAIMFTVYAKKKEIYTIVPESNFFAEMGMDFIKKYVQEKKQRNIATKALWEVIPKRSIVTDNYNTESEIRKMPKMMCDSFETTTFLYDDKVLHIGPKKELYAILVHSKSYHKMMKVLFDTAWHAGAKVSF